MNIQDFKFDWFDLSTVQGTLKGLLQPHSSKTSILQRSAFTVQLSHPYMTTGKTITQVLMKNLLSPVKPYTCDLDLSKTEIIQGLLWLQQFAFSKNNLTELVFCHPIQSLLIDQKNINHLYFQHTYQRSQLKCLQELGRHLKGCKLCLFFCF